MVINCLKCHTEYQLHGELLQRAKKGMPVNCSKCGCCFEVLIITPSSQDDEATNQLNSQFAGGMSI